MVEIIELGELKTVEDATYDQCDENGIDGTSCGGKMISVPGIPNYYGRTQRHLMCQNHIHNYWGAIAWYEQENNLHRLHGNPLMLNFYDGSTESENEEFEAEGNWTPCYHCQTKIGEGEIIYGYKGSRVEAFCDSECIYDAQYVDAETFASECESCDEESDGGVYECDCCYQVYCENCFEETVNAGHSPYRGSIDEWMLITKDPRIEETSTGSSWTGGAICGTCAAEIEAELDDLPPIHEVMEEEQGTANFSMEGQVKKKSNLTELALAGAIIGLLTFSAMKRK